VGIVMKQSEVFVYQKRLPLRERILDEICLARLQDLNGSGHRVRGQRFAVYANDWIGHNVNLYGVYEKELLDSTFGFLQMLNLDFSSHMVLDIGANIGNHCVYFSKLFKRVLAFEPNRSAYDLLRFNTQSCSNVELYNFGLGDFDGLASLFEDLENVGGSSIKYFDPSRQTPVPVQIKKLDFLDCDLSALILVKIDVEGFESSVIKGGLETFCRHRPIILIEQNRRDFPSKGGESEAITLLRDLGYCFFVNQPEFRSENWLSRRIRNLKEMFKGSVYRREITFAAKIPVSNYEMLIAVPDIMVPSFAL